MGDGRSAVPGSGHPMGRHPHAVSGTPSPSAYPVLMKKKSGNAESGPSRHEGLAVKGDKSEVSVMWEANACPQLMSFYQLPEDLAHDGSYGCVGGYCMACRKRI